ncbi:DUF3413 domain-containing protein [Marinomonas sp.]|uniref:DUF3413 domain-containing protein n=1 Tax=Marinomonas sp. TaxID=1904862 RepID=UPI003A907098
MNYKNKLSVYSDFLIVNIFLSIAISTRYFYFMPEFPSGILGPVFIVSSLISHLALLGGLIGLIGFVITLLPRSVYFIGLSLLSTLALSALVVDTFVFSQYRFHINEVVLKLVLSGDVVDFSMMTWLVSVLSFVGVLLIEILLVLYLSGRIEKGKKYRKKGLVTIFVLSFLTSNFIHIWAAANAYQPIMIVKNYLPVFHPATSNSLMQKYGWVDEEAIAKQRAMSIKVSSDLHYPLSELKYTYIDKPVNIVFLVIDSWRYDTFNADNTPNLWLFAQNGVVYDHHMSTGNSTRTGIFGLFYGMPGTYWQNMLSNGRSPIFMDRLQELDYQIGAFASASLMDPEFNRTVFSKIQDLRLRSEGSSPSERDSDLTEDWLKWYESRDTSRPTFSFLFYDAPHGYDFPVDYKERYEPMLSDVNYLALNNDTDPVPFLNRYKTSVHFVDSLSKKVLDAIKMSGELDNTVVVITGDHGQEFNDNKLNYWGHNSNFTPAQTHVPFAIIAPKMTTEHFMATGNVSTHEDVAPTLIKHYLGGGDVPTGDYSTGQDLFESKARSRDWLISSSYSAYSMITKDSILEVGASGQYQHLDLTNRAIDEEPNFYYLKDVLENLSRFKKK